MRGYFLTFLARDSFSIVECKRVLRGETTIDLPGLDGSVIKRQVVKSFEVFGARAVGDLRFTPKEKEIVAD